MVSIDATPRFLVVNKASKLLYLHATAGTSGGTSYESLSVIDINTKKITFGRESPPSNAQEGFAFNRNSNTLYLKKRHEKAILKLDAYAKKVLHTTTLERKSIWKRFYEAYEHLAEVIAVNPSTNKVYVSDSKNNLLYEIDG